VHPILFKIGNFYIPTYGFFVAAGFLLAIALAVRRARHNHIDPEIVTDVAFYILIGALIGARIYYALEHWPYFKHKPWEVLYLWKGGLAFYGGFVGAFALSFLYVKKRKLSVLEVADLIAPSIPAGHAVGRIGCFCAGCCYGKPTSFPWAIVFTDPHSLARLGVPLHPTQLYHALSNIFIFLVLCREYPRRKFKGQVFFSYLLLYAIARFLIEFLRGDPRAFIGPFSLPQWFSVLAAGLSLGFLFILRKR